MERYFINYKTGAVTIETDLEQIEEYFARGWAEISEEEYAREYARILDIWDKMINRKW